MPFVCLAFQAEECVLKSLHPRAYHICRSITWFGFQVPPSALYLFSWIASSPARQRNISKPLDILVFNHALPCRYHARLPAEHALQLPPYIRRLEAVELLGLVLLTVAYLFNLAVSPLDHQLTASTSIGSILRNGTSLARTSDMTLTVDGFDTDSMRVRWLADSCLDAFCASYWIVAIGCQAAPSCFFSK